MKKPNTKYIIYITLLVLAVIAVLYSSVALIMDGSPMLKSMREHVKSANEFHRDSLYDKAIEPYRRAMDMEPEIPLTSYNSATNLLMKNYKDIKDNIADPQVVATVYNDANGQFLAASLKIDGSSISSAPCSKLYLNFISYLHLPAVDILQLAR
jgi:hypothetical protein